MVISLLYLAFIIIDLSLEDFRAVIFSAIFEYISRLRLLPPADHDKVRFDLITVISPAGRSVVTELVRER